MGTICVIQQVSTVKAVSEPLKLILPWSTTNQRYMPYSADIPNNFLKWWWLLLSLLSFILTFCPWFGRYRFRRLLLAVGPLSASNEVRAPATSGSRSWLLTSFRLCALAMTHWHSSRPLQWSGDLAACSAALVSEQLAICMLIALVVWTSGLRSSCFSTQHRNQSINRSIDQSMKKLRVA